MKYRTKYSATVCLFHCHNLLQYLKKPFKSVCIKKSNLKFCTITLTKPKHTHQIPKNQISVAESLSDSFSKAIE